MKKTISLTLVLALCLVAKADFTFGEPTLVPNVNSDYGDTYVRIAADGLSLYITSQRPGGYGDRDIWVAKRPTKNDEWGTPVNLGPKINTSGWDAGASISVDNLTLYFYSQDRPGGYGGFDLWLSTRETTEDDWGDPVNLGPTFNTTGHNWAPNISADNLSLYFTCDRPGGSGGFDMWMCARETIQGNWGTPVHLGFTVNWPYWDCKPDISADERTLFFTRTIKYYPGVDEDFDIWVTRRASSYDDWGEPVPLPINTSYAEGSTSISADGSTLYFMSNRPPATPSGDIWQVSIEPVVDLNSDGIVDAADMCIIVDHWGTDNSLCDIGPMPWGDGVVDVQDLIVLAEHLFEGAGLIAHWALDETEGDVAYDSAGNIDATVYNGQWTTGKVDGALLLNGLTTYIDCGDSQRLGTPKMTLAMWLEPQHMGGMRYVLSRAWEGSDEFDYVLMRYYDDKVEFAVAQEGSDPVSVMSHATTPLSEWTHVAVSLDGSEAAIYINGQLDASAGYARRGPSEGCRLWISSLGGRTRFFNGKIDDVRIYNIALSPEEIAALTQ